MDSLEPQVSDGLAELMDAWSSLIEEVVRLAEAVGRSNAAGPRSGSPYASGVEELRSDPTIPEGPLQLVTLDSLRYLSAAGRHCLAVSKRLAAREVFVSLLPLLRAQLETYGRIAWFLEPANADGHRIFPRRRVARHHMTISLRSVTGGTARHVVESLAVWSMSASGSATPCPTGR